MIIMSSHMISGLLKTKVSLKIVLQLILTLVQFLRFNMVEKKIKELSGGTIQLVLDIAVQLQVLQIATLLAMVFLDSIMDSHGVLQENSGHKNKLMQNLQSMQNMLLQKQERFLLLVRRRRKKNQVMFSTNQYSDSLVKVVYLLLVDRQKELYSNQQMIQHCLISLLHLHLLVILTDMLGVMSPTVTYQSSMVLLNR